MARKPYRKSRQEPARHFIREWRIARNLTQEQLAERLDLSPSNISQIENGKQGYTQSTLEAIAEALSVDAASLLMRDPSDPEGIWSVWEQISPEERARAIDVLKAFTGRAA